MKRIKLALAIALTATLLSPTAARADNCPVYNLNDLFYEEYLPDYVWIKPGQTRTITWTTEATTFPRLNTPVTRKLDKEQQEWAAEAIQSQDDILDSITFKRVDTPQADLTIGYAKIEPTALAWWNVWWDESKIRQVATIRLNQDQWAVLATKINFIAVVQHEVRNVLGSGDIKSHKPVDSVNEDPFRWGRKDNIVTNDDYAILRQIFGESTCLSNSPKSKADAALAAAKAAEQAKIDEAANKAAEQFRIATAALEQALIALAESEEALRQSEG